MNNTSQRSRFCHDTTWLGVVMS